MTTSKLIVSATFIAIVFFILGYSTYPYLQSSHDSVQHESIEKEQQFATDKPPSVSINKGVKGKTLQPNSPFIDKIESTDAADAVDVDTDELFKNETLSVRKVDVNEQTSSQSKDPKFVAEQLNFDSWKQNNKVEILDKMQDMLPASIYDDFTNMIKKDNYFSDLAASQNAISDEEQSQIMETIIRDFIALHELGNQIQIIDLNCVQLSCRIFTVSTEPRAWMNVSLELFFSIIKQGYLPNEANIKKGVSYRADDGNTYAYEQMAFLRGNAQ
jgi:hypothetical protein